VQVTTNAKGRAQQQEALTLQAYLLGRGSDNSPSADTAGTQVAEECRKLAAANDKQADKKTLQPMADA
jgi:hypothetical protein